MRKNILRVWDLPSNSVTAALIIMAVVFLIGGFTGCMLCGQADSVGEAALSCYLDGFFDIASSGEIVKPDFVFLAWRSIRWPLFCLFLGLTPIGLIGIPALILSRALLLSFSIASFYHVSGTEGLLIAFIIFGITGLIHVPILFILGIQSFLRSGSIIGRITGENRCISRVKRSDTICACICFFVLFLFCFIEYSTGPAIFKSAAGILCN